MYEPHGEKLLPWRRFVRRLIRHGQIAAAVIVLSLGLGTVGFHCFALQPWIDAFLNAAMLLGGMGPVGAIEGSGGKIFAALYALYSGIVFLGAAGLLIVPLLHRLIHKLHLEERGEGG